MYLFILAQQDQRGGGASSFFSLIVGILAIIGMWKMFTKAGQPGWAAIIPIYNIYILLKIVGRPWWWLLLLLIPIVNFIILILVNLDLAKSFGKSIAFAIGLILLSPVFYIILGFGSSRYLGPAANPLGRPSTI